ncbi:MAG: PorT family protein [Sphingobacteriaceae bacterium]|nr:PorT family protein [Cytophagaceae bacterium]
MHSTHLRRQFDLPRKKIVLLLALALAGQGAQAQNRSYERRFMEFYDDKTVHYGFFFALPMTRFNVTHSNGFVNGAAQGDSAIAISSPTTTGFRMGFVMNTRLNNRFDFRVTPTVSIYGRSLDYRFSGGGEKSQLRESTWVEIPLLLKYKSMRRGNTRMYLLGGASFGIESNVRKKENVGLNRERLTTRTTDLSLEYGVGLERWFEFFKFSPELRFSHGLVNLFQPNTSTYSQGVGKLTSHTVAIYLMFE